MADIEKMFYQVRVPTEDAKYLRFLWWPGGDMGKAPEEFQMLFHLFGGVSSPSCASYALRRTAYDNVEHFDENTVQTVRRNFYVDDCLKSVEDDQCARRSVEQLCQLLAKGGFRLTKCISSSIYDPLGFVAPLILPAKIILRDLCRKRFDWDDRISPEDLTRWKDWLQELRKLEQFTVKHCLKPGV